MTVEHRALVCKPSTPLVAQALEYAAEWAAEDTTGHDIHHIHRVFQTAQRLAAAEGAEAQTVELIAALHDVADFKFTGDENSGARSARRWLLLRHVPTTLAETVAHNIAGISYKGADTPTRQLTLEGEIVQDADRLDAIGAIGIARCFAYGGAKDRPLHDPEVPVVLHSSTEQYLTHEGTSINHFYEKTLLLKDRLNTLTARKIAEDRHAYTEGFLAQFYGEWEGTR